MPPEVFHCHPLVTSKTPLLSQISPKSRFKRILHQKYCQGVGGRMKFTKMKLIPVLFFVLCSASIIRFLNISLITTNSSAPLPPSSLPSTHQHKCSSESSICKYNISHPQALSTSTDARIISDKEMKFLSEFFSRSVPCNLLVFGVEHHYSSIASLNFGGFTIFLQEHLQKTSTIKSANNTQVHKIKYNTVASKAYQLLKDARENPHCSPMFYQVSSKCNLALSNLPQKVYDTMWDVVVVDGPSGDTLDSPGRMASIYTASILARRGNKTHVIVHDVDRMIEKWFSWEFLCEGNLLSSKGRFWHFQILGVANATTFCTPQSYLSSSETPVNHSFEK
ncbi:hypothetical protein DH2020_042540 [Rehmannia glutinosa]|uniref:Polysaccharide biosynthesis domain-containing protein n=1 Tax=Rehmannia glutinosa TaxID=99300 RepID=A0ABR0UMN0_REHGL